MTQATTTLTRAELAQVHVADTVVDAARLAALVPKPRVNLTLFSGCVRAEPKAPRLGGVRRIDGRLRNACLDLRACLFFVRSVLLSHARVNCSGLRVWTVFSSLVGQKLSKFNDRAQ